MRRLVAAVAVGLFVGCLAGTLGCLGQSEPQESETGSSGPEAQEDARLALQGALGLADEHLAQGRVEQAVDLLQASERSLGPRLHPDDAYVLERRLGVARGILATAAADEPLGALFYTQQAQAAADALRAMVRTGAPGTAAATAVASSGAGLVDLVRRARSSGERDPSHHALLGLGLLHQGDLDAALPAIDEAIADDPSDPAPFVLKSQWFRAKARPDDQVACLEQALVVDETRADTHLELCRALLARNAPGDLDRAREAARRAVGTSRERAAYLGQLFPSEPALGKSLLALAADNQLRQRQRAFVQSIRPDDLRPSARADPGASVLRAPVMGLSAASPEVSRGAAGLGGGTLRAPTATKRSRVSSPLFGPAPNLRPGPVATARPCAPAASSG